MPKKTWNVSRIKQIETFDLAKAHINLILFDALAMHGGRDARSAPEAYIVLAPKTTLAVCSSHKAGASDHATILQVPVWEVKLKPSNRHPIL